MVQKNIIKSKILIICGATATGKSDLAVECAKLLNSEVISADSLYVYRNLNIGTAKPTMDEMQGIRHHLIDVADPNENFTVSDYKKIAQPVIDKLLRNGKTPIICGGTGFYINSLLYDLSYGNSHENTEIREKYKQIASTEGNIAVYNDLVKVDPESASKLHYNDLKRVIRALEIFYSGTKKSDIKDDYTPKYEYNAYAIDYPREVLYNRINLRVDKMLKKGLIKEVENLLLNGVSKTSQCMQGIGYKEVLDYLDKKIDLDELSELIKLNTRHYAKRQITFFKKLERIKYLLPEQTKILAQNIVKDYL